MPSNNVITAPDDVVVNSTRRVPTAPDMPSEYYQRALTATIGFRQMVAQILGEEAALPQPPLQVMDQLRDLQDHVHDMEVWLLKRAQKRYPNFPQPLSHIPPGNPIRHV